MLKINRIFLEDGDTVSCIIESNKGKVLDELDLAFELYNRLRNFTSADLIGSVNDKRNNYDLRKFDKQTIFYNGWIDGRIELFALLSELEKEQKNTKNKNHVFN